MQQAMTTGAVLAGSRIVLDNINSLQPGPVAFYFKLYGVSGQELTANDLKIEHDKKMHFILMRDDMTQFQHIHPAYTDGKWMVTTTIAEQGQYQLYVDIAPEKETAVVLRVPVTIGGPTMQAQNPVPNANNTASADAITAKLTTDKALVTNQETLLTYSLAENGQAIKEIDPYLGAYGHVVLVRHGSPDDFFHVHPITETKPSNGQVQFAAVFPSIGRYTLYAQFSINGKIETFPITADVSVQGDAQLPAPSMMSH